MEHTSRYYAPLAHQLSKAGIFVNALNPKLIKDSDNELVPALPKDELTKRILHQAINQLDSTSKTVEQLRTLINETAAKMPEYGVVMSLTEVDPSIGPQPMAEIGDVSRFTHKCAITAFAGVNPGVNESGSYAQKNVPTTKRGAQYEDGIII